MAAPQQFICPLSKYPVLIGPNIGAEQQDGNDKHGARAGQG